MTEQLRGDARRGVRAILALCGADIDSPEVAKTPQRMVEALVEMTAGRREKPAEILTAEFDRHGYDEPVILRGVDFVSVCEHHLLPFTGRAVVMYVPGQHVVGLSKLARLVDCFARRLQIQERLTGQIAESLLVHGKALGVGVAVAASHSCMCARGVRKPGAEMVTTYLAGSLKGSAATRAELLRYL